MKDELETLGTIESSRPFRCFNQVFEWCLGVNAMKCDECGDEDAVVHLTRITDGRKSERHLCLKCSANETGSGLDINDMLRAWVEKQQGQGPLSGD
jgi:hypothetical protein